MLTAGSLGSNKASGFFGIGQIPMPTNPVIAEIVNATTPINVPPPPYEVASRNISKVSTGILDTVADFVEENKMAVYAGIGIMGFLALWRKK